MKRNIYLILREDIMMYPPVLSIINALVDIGMYNIVHIGNYSDKQNKEKLESKGVSFIPIVKYDGRGNIFKKFYQQLYYKHQVIKYINSLHISDDDLIWLFQSETVALLYSLVFKYKTIIHPFEYVDSHINWKYRLISPFYNIKKTFKAAHKIVCCEYNRAHILKGILGLSLLPTVLPNKPYDTSDDYMYIPNDIKLIIDSVKKKVTGKKVILYQGIFLDGERRLEEFCQAINHMPQDFVFIIMGAGSTMYERLKKQYASEKIIFLPFIRPPYHLLITKLAHIGVLSYFPRTDSMASVLNPLYCAPNKIFEYAKFGIPMLSNEIPALFYTYMQYKCGECIPEPMYEGNIKNKLELIFNDYNSFSEGAIKYYQSIDILQIVKSIVS